MMWKLTIPLAALLGMFGSAALADRPPADPDLVEEAALSASINMIVYALPSGCAKVSLYDLTYFKCAGVWYLPQYGPAGIRYLRVHSRSWTTSSPPAGG